MSLVEHVEFDNARDFVTYLRKSNDHWWDGGHCKWVFRGHFNADWALRPSAFREATDNKLTPLVELLRGTSSRSDHGITSELEWTGLVVANAECEALHRFAALANELHLGFHVPPPSPVSQGGLIPFQRPDIPHVDDYPPTYFRNAGSDLCCPPLRVAPLAQHHQIPTRLLDFSADPLAAAYFAVDPMLRPAGVTPTAIAVWALNRQVERMRFEPNCAIQLIDYATGFPADEYVRAQKGCFVRIRNAVPHFINTGSWPALDLMTLKPNYNSSGALLRKVVLPFAEIDKLCDLLRREGWTHAHMMPTLDNVARSLMEQWNT